MPLSTLRGLRAWLLDRALPLWLHHGIDRIRGGFHESLSHDGYACAASYRRLRVLARQTVVFSHAHRNGVPRASEAVAMGIDLLARHAALPEGGYAWRFGLDHAPIDTTRDLYDHAFVLLALAEATSVLPAATLRPRAHALLAFLDTSMAHPAGGYAEAIPAALPRRQNPHMHLLEALLAANAAFADPVFLDRAHALVRLFTDRLVDPATNALPEYFDDVWRPVSPDGVFETEPGHHHEWAWLLHDYDRLAPADARRTAMAARLLAFADAHGTHPTTHDLIDSVGSNAAPLARSARLWPQAERLKTAHLRPDRTAAHARTAQQSLAAYLLADGLWHERRDEHGAFVPGPSPASSLYHLTTAILTATATPD